MRAFIAATVIAQTASFCATPSGSPASVGWQWQSEIVDREEALYGPPVWSADGIALYGLEWTFEQRNVPAEWIDDSRDRRHHELAVVEIDPVSGAVSPLFDAPVYGQPLRLFALDDDTFLVHVLLADGDDSWLRITRDGDLADLAISTGTEPSRADVLPSPDGSLLAVTRCTPPAEAHRPAACAVSFVDAFTGALVEPESKVDLPWTVDTRWTTTRRRTDGPWTWTADGRFLLTDWSRAAIALGPGSQPVSTEVPDCFGPRTASSRVAIDGTVARWVDGALVLSTTLEEGIGTFGCWD